MTELHFDRNNGEIDDMIEALIARAGAQHPELIREMMLTTLKTGQEGKSQADLMLINATLKELRYTSKIFNPYRGRRKVTIFGSARTSPDEDIYRQCSRFSGLLADHNYMVITGGGGGIMQAGNEGAGAERSFAASIRLPFEASVNDTMSGSNHHITYKYFFTRKVCMVKEADAVALFPGGFGTLDEATEILTLMQTGKSKPVPLLLFDTKNRDFWTPWINFTKDTLLRKKLISESDLNFFVHVSTPEEGLDAITGFYRRYHSCRHVKERLVIRLNKELSPRSVEILNNEFSRLVTGGDGIRQCHALPEEKDDIETKHLSRLVFKFNKRDFGGLQGMILKINALD